MTNYWDKNGRLHHKPVTETKPYPSGNSFLYTGYASLVGVPVNETSVAQCWAECQTEYGYNRNPDGDIFPNSSHDEVVGVFMTSTNKGLCKDYFNKLEQQFFQICNLPNFTPKPLYKLNPIKVAKDLYALSKEENPRKSTYKYPHIFPVTFRHMPQHTYFYARCANIKVCFIHTLYFFVAALSTIFGRNNSSRTMLGFKLLKLQQLGLTFTEKLILTIYNKRVNFAEEVYQYFPSDHDIVKAVNGKKEI